MPLPEPRPDEPKEEFLQRCMHDDGMKREYPHGDQRYAVCARQWLDRDA